MKFIVRYDDAGWPIELTRVDREIELPFVHNDRDAFGDTPLHPNVEEWRDFGFDWWTFWRSPWILSP